MSAARRVSTGARRRDAGFGDDASASLEATVASERDAAVEAARALPAPSVSALFDFVVRPRPERPEPPVPAADAPVFRMLDALHEALETELAADDRVMVAGIAAGEGGTVFGPTTGPSARCGEPVRDRPIPKAPGGSADRRGG